MSEEQPPADEPKSERFNMLISRSEMDAIDAWAWENRVRSKSEAVRRLCQIGLAADLNLARLKTLLDEAENTLLQDQKNIIDSSKASISEAEFKKVFATTISSYVRLTDLVNDISRTVRATFQKTATFRDVGTMPELMAKADQLEEAFMMLGGLLVKGRTLKGDDK